MPIMIKIIVKIKIIINCFSNFILLSNIVNVTSTNLASKLTCIWLAYSN